MPQQPSRMPGSFQDVLTDSAYWGRHHHVARILFGEVINHGKLNVMCIKFITACNVAGVQTCAGFVEQAATDAGAN